MPLDSTNWPQPVGVGIDETTALLMRARGFLERGWCKGVLAVNANKQMVNPCSKQAVAWCAGGALFAAGVLPLLGIPHHPAFDRLMEAMGGESIARFNNRQETVEPVIAAFDRAIEMGGQ